MAAACLQEDRHETPNVKLQYRPRQVVGPTSHRPCVQCPPVNLTERSVLCTIGPDPTGGRAYPPDGVCRWIAYTHVSFDPINRTLLPYTDVDAPASLEASWAAFVQRASSYRHTRLLPSIRRRSLLLAARHTDTARDLNRSTAALHMCGLAVLNARMTVQQTWQLSRAIDVIATVNPGSFLVLGASFVGLSDRTASRLIPGELLDALVTPLSLFVLETHLPVPGKRCEAGFTTSSGPHFGQRDALTLKGAKAFLRQPALKYVQPEFLGRCVSVLAGALQFQLTTPTLPVPGAPCSSWKVAELRHACRLPSVRVNEEVRCMFGHDNASFFSYESEDNILRKVKPFLLGLANEDLPTCMAVYSIETDALPGQCPIGLERYNYSLAYSIYDLLYYLRLP
ncbi:uncharacterized protein LOC144167934 [Haemaphysalis longicornis]